ncbi:hypothetical protein R9X47_21780 [Wukongibacter baidiensis]|uniref:hypothetical protein n=1 Tax=Wukongibacter baidiensis TaxID=1723361 RepID=UPI003D7F52CA
MTIISLQNLIIGILLSVITMYVVKYVDIAAINILRNRRLTKALISLDILILVTTTLLVIDWIICKVQILNSMLNLH